MTTSAPPPKAASGPIGAVADGIVYKIAPMATWRAATLANLENGAGTLQPSADDARDGFIHLSASHQLAETARRYFAGQPDLCLIAYRAEDLGSGLVWEASRGGDMFPHFYGSLSAALALWARPLPLDTTGLPQTDAVINQP